jgi:hypothetical protein
MYIPVYCNYLNEPKVTYYVPSFLEWIARCGAQTKAHQAYSCCVVTFYNPVVITHYRWTGAPDADFLYIFPAENNFFCPRNFPENFRGKTIIEILFRGKFKFPPTFLGRGKIFAEFPQKFPREKCT